MGSGFDIMAFMPFIFIFGVFYFLLIRPQQQKMKKHNIMLSNLRRGDRVVTNGGLIGTISKIVSDSEVQLELTDDVRVRHVRAMIAEVLTKDPASTVGTASTTVTPSNQSVASQKKSESLKNKGSRKVAVNRSMRKAKV
ncbi:MAG: preprotein translocase subunit YajC [Alphaproteobacteria bacterium]|nr:preprotein translocase subunit YajC [Alphaproteobacteria bacterium]